MKNLSAIALLFAGCSLLASTAVCQSSDDPANDPPSSVVEARCRYATADEACASQAPAEQSSDSARTVAQIPRRFPGMGAHRPPRPMMAYPMPEPSLRHAAIGGLIGFVLGVSRPNTASKDRLALGVIVGLVGAGIGAAIPSFHGRYSNPRGPWPDDEEDEMGSNKPSTPSAGERQAGEVALSQTVQPSRETALQSFPVRSPRPTP